MSNLNDILHVTNKKGGIPHPKYLLKGFHDIVDSCNLIDLPLIEYPFTWQIGK